MEANDKRAQILEAAIRRFAHFGVQKTTLTEIADDLGMTKQALAYYYPDKNSLSEAVEALILTEFFTNVEAHLAQAPTAAEAIMDLVEVKKTFFEKYAMLMRAAGPELMQQHSKAADAREAARQRLTHLMAQRLEQGVGSGELKPLNAPEVASLVFDTMSAFEQCVVGRQMIPDARTFSELCSRQKAVLQLMMNGLKEEAWKN